MGIEMEKPPGDMNLTDLVKRCSHEMGKFRRKEQCNDQYCLEIFHRALVEHDEAAWEALYVNLSEHVHTWFRRHQYREAALRLESEQSYIDDAFKRFWHWTSNRELDFTTLASALSSLHLCLNSAIMDTLRAYSRPKEDPLPDEGLLKMIAEDIYHEDEWWPIIADILKNEREQRIIYLLYHCGLKPKVIMQQRPEEFASEQEIYRLTRNALDRLKRNSARLRWKLSDDQE